MNTKSKTVYIIIFIAIFLFLLASLALVRTNTSDIIKQSKTPKGMLENKVRKTYSMFIKSAQFENGGSIPAKYTCDGDNINPPLSFDNVPEGAKSLVLIMDDPDIPTEVKQSMGIDVFDHWILYNIPVHTKNILENGREGTLGKNTTGGTEYTGPCPPSQYQPTTHRYVFTLYALDTTLNFSQAPTKQDVTEAMQGHILEQAQLIGTYDRSK